MVWLQRGEGGNFILMSMEGGVFPEEWRKETLGAGWRGSIVKAMGGGDIKLMAKGVTPY